MLFKHGTWEYVTRTANIRPFPYTWNFNLKVVDAFKDEYLAKARCCLRGDRQKAWVDFDPESVYAPVALHESHRMLIAFSATNDLVLEGADISNAYLVGNLDVPIIMEQPTGSSRQQTHPGKVCRLIKSIYFAKQTGAIRGSLLATTLTKRGFKDSVIDRRIYFARRGEDIIIIGIVVNDLAFASNSQPFLNNIKGPLSSTFAIKLFGALQTLIGWDIHRTPAGIKIDQRSYVKGLVERHGLSRANGANTPLPVVADVVSAKPTEPLLDADAHGEYRAQVGTLLYAAVCTCPDLSNSVSLLAQQLHAPTERHNKSLKRVMRFVGGPSTKGLFYPAGKPLTSQSPGACVPANWGGYIASLPSTTSRVLEDQAPDDHRSVLSGGWVRRGI